MTNKQKILLSLAILILFNLFLVIVFGDKGLVDYHLLKKERDRLIEKNNSLAKENLHLYREIDRLKTDLKYIENPDLKKGVIKKVYFTVDGADVTITRTVWRNGSIYFTDVFKTHYEP